MTPVYYAVFTKLSQVGYQCCTSSLHM